MVIYDSLSGLFGIAEWERRCESSTNIVRFLFTRYVEKEEDRLGGDKRKVSGARSLSGRDIAFHRWDKGGPGDDVVVVANFFDEPQDGYVIGFPAAGTWKLRFNSDWQGYNDDFKNHPSTNVIAEVGTCDGLLWQAAVSIGPCSVLIFCNKIRHAPVVVMTSTLANLSL